MVNSSNFNKHKNDELLIEDQAAKFIGVQPKTLQSWRYQGEGPKFITVRPRVIRYWRSDVIEWLNSNIIEGGSR